MSKGLGSRQRDILAKLTQHRDHPPDYNGRWQHRRMIAVDGQPQWEQLDPPVYCEYPGWMRDPYPEWMTVRELAGLRVEDLHCRRSSDVEATRRAVRKLEAAGLVETKPIWRHGRGQRQIGVRLT
jgi:hypothetical protein